MGLLKDPKTITWEILQGFLSLTPTGLLRRSSFLSEGERSVCGNIN